VEEHFDELLAEKAAEAVALHEVLERAEAACQESSTPETRSTLADARAACTRMAQPAAWRHLSETPRGSRIKRDDPGWSVHEGRVLGQASQAGFALKLGTDHFGHGNTPGVPRQVPMPPEFARHLGLLKPILH